ncbi:MAG TPA: RNA polymerase factor sigma-54 [Alphaproteobacteria bacterium]|nr:RNA polymerase factor sigma-54 [Alphaproteobacteria bacterium]
MALNQRLDLRQAQTLVMTPQLQQAIKLLQLSNLELSEYVDEELEKNPLLQRDDDSDGTVDGDRQVGAGDDGDEAPQPVNGDAAALETFGLSASDGVAAPGEAPLDTDYENMWNGGTDPAPPTALPSASNGQGSAIDTNVLEQTIADTQSLNEYLQAQIDADIEEPRARAIASHLMSLLDEAGYLTGDTEQTAEQLGCPCTELEDVIARLQSLEPTGVFARNLSECLALQLIERDRYDPAMAALVDNLDLIAKRDFAGLKRLCGIDGEDLADMLAELKRLNPKPALAFSTETAMPVTPDVFVRADAGGGWVVELNSDTLPRVLVDRSYHAEVGARARSDDDRNYINEQFQSANWLVRALDQRANTILKVSTELVRQQDGFLRHGIRHLKPLVLRDIAEKIEMHESTVSRVTTNKFIATPRGIFELKYFFTAAIASSDGGVDISAEAVRHRIKVLVAAEPADAVLSDDALVNALRSDGVDIARRTVAKYREALKIPSSVERRRDKNAVM